MLKVLIWLDIAIFKILTLNQAKPGETISAAAYRAEQQGRWLGKIARPVIDFLIPFGPQPHCYQAYLWQIDIYGSNNDEQ
jgi:hypothetical protein